MRAWRGGRAWQGVGCMAGGACVAGACVAKGVHGGGACVVGGGCAWQIPRDTVNERAVHILLECIHVLVLNEKKKILVLNEKKTHGPGYRQIIWQERVSLIKVDFTLWSKIRSDTSATSDKIFSLFQMGIIKICLRCLVLHYTETFFVKSCCLNLFVADY